MGAKNFAIGFAIAVILPCVVHYGVMSFSFAAKYGSCSERQHLEQEGVKDPDAPANKAVASALKAEYQKGRGIFNKHLFYIAVPAGIFSVAAGLMIPIPGIGTGFMFGGLLTLLYGFFTYWDDLPVQVRFVSLLFGLILFVVIGWVKYRKKAA